MYIGTICCVVSDLDDHSLQLAPQAITWFECTRMVTSSTSVQPPSWIKAAFRRSDRVSWICHDSRKLCCDLWFRIGLINVYCFDVSISAMIEAISSGFMKYQSRMCHSFCGCCIENTPGLSSSHTQMRSRYMTGNLYHS